MSRKVALLRGINVGKGGRIAMADLIECTEDAGCTQVRTVLATGNVVLTDPRSAAEVRTVLETAYAERFGYSAVVQVLTRDAVGAAVETYPFDTLDQHHDYVVFSDDSEVTENVLAAMSAAITRDTSESGPAAGTEAAAAGPGCLHWRVPKGSTLASAAGKTLDAKENKRHLTTRNIRTLRKVLALG